MDIMKPRLKERLQIDMSAGLPLIGIIIAIGVSAAVVVGAYVAFQKPNITYNIDRTGFALAGVDVSWWMIIAIGAVIAVGLLWLASRKKKTPYRPL